MTENQKQPQDEKWESRSTECEEAIQLTAENSPIQGVYLATKWVDGKFGMSALHMLRTRRDGQPYVLGVWGFTSLNRGMATVYPGTKCRLLYKGEKDIGKGNPMQIADVQVPAGSRSRPIGSYAEPQKVRRPQGEPPPQDDEYPPYDDDIAF